MNILVVSRSLPQPTWGAGTRNYHLLRALARQHTVSLLALVKDEVQEQIAASHPFPHTRTIRQVFVPLRSGNTKRFDQIRALTAKQPYYLAIHSSPAAQAALDDELAQHDYDAVLFESLAVAHYQVPPHIHIILDEHNLEYELLWRTYQGTTSMARRGFNWLEYRRVKPLELAAGRRADLILVTSEREQAALQTLLPEKNIHVVPNGVDIEAFAPNAAIETIPGRIIFTASFDYYPNIQGALYFAEQCWPLIQRQMPTATWHLVGRNPPAEIARLGTQPGITVSANVPAIQPHLAAAEVTIVPLLTGAGTRLKILEAMAMQRAVVSTTLGCEGIACIPDKQLLVADEPAQFAEAVVGLLKDGTRRTTLGDAGRALVEERYSWKYCGDQLLAALDEAAQNGWSK